MFNLLGSGDNMDHKHMQRVQDQISVANSIASAMQNVDRRFKAMEMRIAELEQLYVPKDK